MTQIKDLQFRTNGTTSDRLLVQTGGATFAVDNPKINGNLTVTANGTFHNLTVTGTLTANTGGGGGATTFLGLTDTPANYTGANNKLVLVNGTSTALVFGPVPGALASRNTVSNVQWSGQNLQIVNGGTGANTASGARTSLGLQIGSDVQAYDATLAALAAFNTNGILTQTAADTFTARTMTGTANEISVSNGDGVSGNPTWSLPSALTFTGKTVTGGAFTGGTWNSGAIGGTTPASGAFTTISATGLTLTAASASGGAGFRLPHGAAPTSPTNGDLWTTTAGLYAQISGTTVGPFSTSSGSVIVDSAQATPSAVEWKVSGSNRYRFERANDSETGSNAGSTLQMLAYNDSGTLLGSVFDITRSTQAVKFYANMTMNNGLLLTSSSSTSRSGLRLPHGSAPTTPTNGDAWTTTGGFFVRINGATQQMANQTDVDSEVITLAPSANQNDYATGVSTKKAVQSTVIISPTNSIKITGFSTTSWQTGKRIKVINGTSRTASTARMIILERNSASSLAANRMDLPPNVHGVPVILMPEDECEIFFDGTNLNVINGTRVGSINNMFDTVMTGDGVLSGTGWTSGTGSGTFSNSWRTIGSNIYIVSEVDSGTTTTGRAHAANAPAMYAGSGAMLSIVSLAPNVLSTATDEFLQVGGFHDAHSGTLTDMIGWVYTRPVSTLWQTRTMSNGVATSTAITGLTVSISQIPLFGTFVNGNGTNVEFFYSTDDGATWTFTPTQHTTNIPTGTARTFGNGHGIQKTAGTTNVWAYSSIMGYRWQRF
jgi:hypothetical protein